MVERLHAGLLFGQDAGQDEVDEAGHSLDALQVYSQTCKGLIEANFCQMGAQCTYCRPRSSFCTEAGADSRFNDGARATQTCQLVNQGEGQCHGHLVMPESLAGFSHLEAEHGDSYRLRIR